MWKPVGKFLDKNVPKAEAVRNPLKAVGGALVRLRLNAVPNAGLQLRWNILAHELHQSGGAHCKLSSIPFKNSRQKYLSISEHHTSGAASVSHL